jgi:hypothetical protein
MIFKQLSIIPAIFKINWDDEKETEKLNDKIMLGLNGNAILFTDIKGRNRIYDRNTITKIIVKKI